MTDQHRAMPESWALMGELLDENPTRPVPDCLLELRARVEALEAAQRPSRSIGMERLLALQDQIQEGSLSLAEVLDDIREPVVIRSDGTRCRPAPANSLVERVQSAIDNAPPDTYREARTAIREVAAWLTAEFDERPAEVGYFVDMLLSEASR